MKAIRTLLLVLMLMTVANPTLAADDDIEVPNALRTPIEKELTIEGRPVRLILPENFDKGHDLIPLILHLHGALPFPDAPDLELDASGYRDLPGKYRVMVAAPRAALNPVLGLYAWNAFFSLAGCGPVKADDVGFLDESGTRPKETTVNKFKQCSNGIDVELWSMEGVPHPPLFFRVGPNGIKTLAEKTWKFLRKHGRDANDDGDDE